MTSQAELRFTKMSGAGNDFILVDGDELSAGSDPAALARTLCPRRTAVGADGLVVVRRDAGSDELGVRFWNPDGSEIGTCGNGTRCAARFARLEGLAGDEMVLRTSDARIRARVDGERVALTYDVAPTVELDVTVTGSDGPVTGHRVDVGIPHLIVLVDELPDVPIEPICRPLRLAPELRPGGANVNLVEVVDQRTLRIRTYERGVEEETLACGSGSMASAVAAAVVGRVTPPVSVETRSGDLLTIRFSRGADDTVSDLRLEGPARVIYRARTDAGALQLGGSAPRRPGR